MEAKSNFFQRLKKSELGRPLSIQVHLMIVEFNGYSIYTESSTSGALGFATEDLGIRTGFFSTDFL